MHKPFNCPIGFVPILGPVEHHELMYEKEAARLALFSYTAARNFRNIWYHFPEKFEEFQSILQNTWPGMDIQRPEIDRSHGKPRLLMFCPENRIPRELFWSGFGFQVWCQMLTHVIQSNQASLFLIDEPDIYLHSELQRQLLGILRSLGPDILLATHSTEMITEAETNDIVLVNKGRLSARRINDPSQLSHVFNVLGSNMNPVLTQLAKTKRAVFVEGKDFQIFSKFARKLGVLAVSNRRDFAVIPIEGFNPERIRHLKEGMEATLGSKIAVAAILDRDYRSDNECEFIENKCREFCDYITIHKRKELENFLLVPSAVNRAAGQRIAEQVRRSGTPDGSSPDISVALNEFCESKKSYVFAQILEARRRFERENPSHRHDTKVTEMALEDFEKLWKNDGMRLNLVPGKEALSALNKFVQERFGVSVTPNGIIEAMHVNEVPDEMSALIGSLKDFSTSSPQG